MNQNLEAAAGPIEAADEARWPFTIRPPPLPLAPPRPPPLPVFPATDVTIIAKAMTMIITNTFAIFLAETLFFFILIADSWPPGLSATRTSKIPETIKRRVNGKVTDSNYVKVYRIGKQFPNNSRPFLFNTLIFTTVFSLTTYIEDSSIPTRIW